MNFARIAVLAGVLFAFVPAITPAKAAFKPSLNNVVFMYLKGGRVTILLRPDLAPHHVARVKKLVRQGFYNGNEFFRVIAGFMAQTGDPTNTGRGSSPYPDLKAEFTNTPFLRGTVGAARASDPNSANSQFFICFKPAPFLNGKYTVWGQVIGGMQYVDQIKKGNPISGHVDHPSKIIKMVMATDSKDAAAKAGAEKLLQNVHIGAN